MPAAFSDVLPHPLLVHGLVVEIAVPNGEGSTRRRSNQPRGLQFVDELASFISVRLEIEVLRVAVGLENPNVHSPKSFNVEGSPGAIGILDDFAAAIHFHET